MAEVVIKKVTRKFGAVKAVNGFDAVIRDGEFVSILGPSGCGKTTMLRMIAGFDRPDEGEILLGKNIVSSAVSGVFLPPERRNIGMVFQSYAVWPHMNVFDNVAYPLKIKRLPKEEIRQRTQHVLGLVHLDGYETRYPNQLSGGQQQRVALARALVSEPGLLLLDEPLSNLDAKLRESMRFEIKDLQKKLKITVVYVTHDQAEAMAMSDRIIVMNSGVIQQTDVPVRIYENPANRMVADFIGLVNFLPGEVTAEGVSVPALGAFLPGDQPFTGPATVAIRPEHILFVAPGEGIPGRILHRFYLGDSVDYRVAVKDQIIRVMSRMRDCEDCTYGDEVGLVIENFMIFPS